MTPPAGVLAAVRQPQHTQCEDAVDDGLRLRRVDRNHSPRLLSLEQRSTRIRRAEAPLEIHRRAEAVGLPVAEAPQHRALQCAQIAHPRGLARGRRSAVWIGENLQ